ncbi:MAG: MFS transporter [Alphaproteobacteria bacterium]
MRRVFMNKGVAACVAAIGVFALTAGITAPLLALILERNGLSSAWIGANAAMLPLGILASAFSIPSLTRRYGTRAICIAAFATTSVLIIAVGATQDPWLWFPLRFLMGASINVLFVISETWILQLATPERRARTVAIYVTVAAGGFAIGPLILTAVGTVGWPPFLAAALGPLLAVPVLLVAWQHLPEIDESDSGSLWRFCRAAPLLLVAIGAYSLFDQTNLSLIPVFGLRLGLTETNATIALSILLAGNVALQYPIGWIADHMSRRATIAWLAVLTLVGCAGLPTILGDYWLWPLLFLWGAVGFGGYTVAVAELGDRFSGGMLMAGNAAFSIAFGLGGVIGPPFAGAAMQFNADWGLPAILGLTFAGLALAAVLLPLTREMHAES